MRSTIKQKLFAQGASAASAALGAVDTYYCPLCAGAFDVSALASGELTLEHVPPEAQGGKGIILTCKRCNNTAGHTLDAEVAKRETFDTFLQTFARQREGYAGRAVLALQGHKVNVDVHHNDGKVNFKILGRSNNPAVVEQLQEYTKRVAKSGGSEGLSMSIKAVPSYRRRLADLSDLRSAFLACTAAMGYRFAFSPALNRVRDQLNNAKQSILPPWVVKVAGQPPARRIVVSEDAGVILVSCDSTTILLPWPPKGETGFFEMSASAVEGTTVNLKGVEVAWPTSFVAQVDLASRGRR